MAKRTSEYQLTKDNYNDDDDDAKDVDNGNDNDDEQKKLTATPEVLKNRILIKAKRRNLQDSTSSSNVFSGFKGKIFNQKKISDQNYIRKFCCCFLLRFLII